MASDHSPRKEGESLPSHTTGEAPSGTVEVIAPKLSQAERVDKFLLSHVPISRSALQRLFEQEKVFVNGSICKKNYKVKSNDKLQVIISQDAPAKTIEPVAHDLNIIYEDEHLVVLNKEPGMAVHPGQGEDANEKVTLVHALLYRYGREGLSEGEEGGERPGIVHRLDKDTSGIMIVCKTNEAHAKLKEQLNSRHDSITKTYYALVLGKFGNTAGTIDSPMMRHPSAKMGHKMVIAPVGDPKGKPAVTHYKVVKAWHLQRQSYALLEVNIETGRMHQIRVHLSSQSHPIIGDALYSTKDSSHQVPYQLLTSKELKFEHPITKEKRHFTIGLPPHFSDFVQQLDEQQASYNKSQAHVKKGKKLHNPYDLNVEDLEI